MSSAIRDVEKLNQRQIETAKRRNERELKTMENNHQSHRAELQKTQANELVDIQHAHHAQISQQAVKKEKILEEMKSHLEQTKNLTEKELKSLKEAAEKDLVNHQKRLTMNRERLNSDNELYLDELNYRFNESAKKVSGDGKKRVDDVKTKMQDEYQHTESYYQDKINKKTNEFTTRFKHDDMNYKKMKDHQDNQFKKERMATNVRQQTELQKMTDAHTGHIEKKDQNFRKGLKDQDLFFEKKYADQLGRHQNEFKTLEEKNNKVLEGLKASLTQEVTKVVSKSNDPFYKFDTLKPRLKQFEDRVEVEVDIPDHSKQDVQLTIHGKEAIIAFNRRYNDAVKLEDGSINKINKVESFTTRLPTIHILDAKSVKSSYDNGVMTYIIKKV
jgi:HSP20 family molecular chaperone IbpA